MYEKQQFFVIRLKKNALVWNEQPFTLHYHPHSHVLEDFVAHLGFRSSMIQYHYHIVSFMDLEGNRIHVATNLFRLKPEVIAELYCAR
nr:hypothetical protein [Thermoactinomyces mirandus]